MEQTLELARELVRDIGRDTAAWMIFDVERDYWQRRNRAGYLQKARQDRLGLGCPTASLPTAGEVKKSGHLLP